jgi:MYXO-CTERM domain-containing protein
VAYYHDFLVGFMDEHAASDAGVPETDGGSAGADGGAVDGGSGAGDGGTGGGDGGTGARDGGNASPEAGLRPDGAHRADGGPVMDMGSSGGCSVSAGPGRGAVSLWMFLMLTAAGVARTRRGRRGAARRRPQA